MKLFLALILSMAFSALAQDIPITWKRVNEVPQSEVRDGVCVVYMPDTSVFGRYDRLAMEPLVQKCINQGGLTGKGDFRLRWTQHETDSPIREFSVNGARAAASNGTLAGASKTFGDLCIVHTLVGYATLGHELKHCYEGSWHR